MSLTVLHNRWWRVVIYSMALLFTNVLHAGWVPMVRFMRDSGKFEWVCPADSVPDPDTHMLCPAQELAFTFSLSLVSFSDFSMSFISGYVFDVLGPQVSGLIGQALFWCALPTVSLSTTSAGMYIGFVFLGLCCSFTHYPALSISTSFKANEQFVIACMMAVQYGTSLVYPVLYHIGKSTGASFGQVTMGYWFAVAPIGALYVLSLPRTTRKEIEEAKRSVPNPNAPKMSDFLKTPEYLAQGLWQLVYFLSYTIFQSTILTWGGEAVSEFYGWLGVAAITTTVFWGYIGARTFSSLVVMFVTIGLMSAFGLTYGSAPADYAACVVLVLVASYFFASKVAYINEVFPPEYMGRLTGLTSTCAGVVSLLATPIMASPLTFVDKIGVFLALLGVGLCCNVFMVVRQGVFHISYRSDTDTNDTTSEETDLEETDSRCTSDRTNEV
ncbi:MAG: uncharacterized protein KVP18_000319 [Porospora cf. gigantea A]|uniref:uncharacterized protein n=2 Tax=Porospora cf. gigantea A TaxID=2853593 RepID=UPI0035596740|nr:MAG: hypothetical protein KVP18_000319 [Porospora cf. gigantea A]